MADTSEAVQRKLVGVYQRTLFYVPNLDPVVLAQKESHDPDYTQEKEDGRKAVGDVGEANAVGSLAIAIVPDDDQTYHMPCFDVDLGAWFEDGWLYFGATTGEDTADALAKAFLTAGVLEPKHRFNVLYEDGFAGYGPFASKVTVVPSSTKGHFHVYIDAPVEAGAYRALLKALAAAGVVEENYVKVALKRKGTTFLRLKHNKDECQQAAADEPPRPEPKKSITEPF